MKTKSKPHKKDIFRLCIEYEIKNNLTSRKLKVFDVGIGDIVQKIALFRDDKYDQHLEDHEVTLLFWDKGNTDYTDYYTPIRKYKP